MKEHHQECSTYCTECKAQQNYLQERAWTAEVKLASLVDCINQELREANQDRSQIRDPLRDDNMQAVVRLLVDVTRANAAKAVTRASRRAYHCALCNKPMQFYDGICFACNGGKDPGD